MADESPAGKTRPSRQKVEQREKDEWRTKVLPDKLAQADKSRAKKQSRVADVSPAEQPRSYRHKSCEGNKEIEKKMEKIQQSAIPRHLQVNANKN